MERETGFTSPLRLFSENPEEVLRRLRAGSIEDLGGAKDAFTDPKDDDRLRVRRGRVVYHSKDRDELGRKMIEFYLPNLA
jgi:hypothetical protein